MNEQQLMRHLRWCKVKWNGKGEDIFQEACMLALARYGSLDLVNQALFSRICYEAARNLRRQFREVKYEYESDSYDSSDSICTICAGRISCDECDEVHLMNILTGQLSLPFEKGGE